MTHLSATTYINEIRFTINKDRDGSIHITPCDHYKSVKEGLQNIAKANNIKIDLSWNTRYMGYRVIRELNGKRFQNSLIEQEAELANKYYLVEEDNDGSPKVKICQDNVAKVEAMISFDSKYTRSGDEFAYPDKKWISELNNTSNFDPFKNYNGYRGSTAFWMKRLFAYYFPDTTSIYKEFENISKSEDYFTFLIFNAVCAVDSENSTHINADGVGRCELTERIVKHKDDLLAQLKNTEEYPLIQLLSESTNPRNEPKHNPRNNFSFATKFCHYACYYIFEDFDVDCRDLYSIYDKVVSLALKCFYEFKDISPDMKNNMYYVEKYRNYIKKIDEIRNNTISRNGFDHLFWYYYKGKGKQTNMDNLQ